MIEAIHAALERAMAILQGDIRKELIAQGHYNTGRLHDSIQYRIDDNGSDTVTAVIECEEYGLALEFGVKPDRIPFGRGGGGASKYIQGLITFFKSKGLEEREAVGAAFATAHVHAREGMPTFASSRFSKSGDRVGFASTALERDLEIIGRVIEETTGAKLTIEFSQPEIIEPIIFYT